jgi:hypothetical protein
MIAILIVIFSYASLSWKNKQKQAETDEVTAVQDVLLRDLEKNYPQSPKEVVKYYSDITKVFYNEDYTDEELEQLAMKAKALYDDELAAEKDDETYLKDLKSEITSFKDNGYVLSSYATSSSTDVFYFSEEGYDCARLYCTYYIRSGTNMKPIEEVFVLRKDTSGHWKIFGWSLADETTDEDTE